MSAAVSAHVRGVEGARSSAPGAVQSEETWASCDESCLWQTMEPVRPLLRSLRRRP